jgi:hypothetical protein
MNFNITIEDSLGQQIQRIAAQIGKQPDEVVQEALQLWLSSQHSSTWSDVVLNFAGDPNVVPFESSREDLLPPRSPELF